MRRIAVTLDCVRRIEQGDLSARVSHAASADEVGALQRGVNAMGERIEQRTREQREAQEARCPRGAPRAGLAAPPPPCASFWGRGGGGTGDFPPHHPRPQPRGLRRPGGATGPGPAPAGGGAGDDPRPGQGHPGAHRPPPPQK